MADRGVRIPTETLLALRTRLAGLPTRSAVRREEVGRTADLFGVSPSTVYRSLKALHQPKGLKRADRGKPRSIPEQDLARYCEIIAALKIRTGNRKGRHLSTSRAIELLEEHGVQTPSGHVRPPPGLLKRSTVNRWLKDWGLDHPRMTRAAPATRFEARHSNACWQFDISPSDLKHVSRPAWVDPSRGQPTMQLFSVVDDRSGTSYQEYRCVYGEDAESALLFLFNAMAPKEDTSFQGIPGMLYLDNVSSHKAAEVHGWLKGRPDLAVPLHPDLGVLNERRRGVPLEAGEAAAEGRVLRLARRVHHGDRGLHRAQQCQRRPPVPLEQETGGPRRSVEERGPEA